MSEAIWREDKDGVWGCSECDLLWTFEWDGPEENDVRYCPKCGKRIVEVCHYEDGGGQGE